VTPAPQDGIYADDKPRDTSGLTFVELRAATLLRVGK
jgi:hypothetical protein